VDHVCFGGLILATAPGRVMTPRGATERLVTAAVEWLEGRAARVVDVGTGSGAVATAIAVAAPQVELWATDTSRWAVELAEANVRRHGLEARVRVSHGDLLEPVPGAVDLIVANLPYLPATAAAAHPDLDGEPPEAVFAAGDGLGLYRRLVAAAGERLDENGALIFQLHRRVFTAGRAELPALAAVLRPRVDQLAA
jgi:HemK-like putative methylase